MHARRVRTYFIGSGDEWRKRWLSVFRGTPWGSDGLRGGRNVTDAVDDFLDVMIRRSLLLSLDACREGNVSVFSSVELNEDVTVVVLAPDDGAAAIGGDAASGARGSDNLEPVEGFGGRLDAELAEK